MREVLPKPEIAADLMAQHSLPKLIGSLLQVRKTSLLARPEALWLAGRKSFILEEDFRSKRGIRGTLPPPLDLTLMTVLLTE